MANVINVKITGDASDLKSELNSASGAIDKFDKTASQAGGGLSTANQNATSLSATMKGALVAGAAAAAAALAVAAQQAVTYTLEAGKMAMESERLGSANQKLAVSIGESSQTMVDAIVNASGKTITEMDAMRISNLAMMSGVAANAQEMATLTEIATTMGRALGMDTSEAVARLTEAIAKNETELLDEFGIVVRANTAYAAYAAEVGKSANALTQEEKSLAFKNATLNAGIEAMLTLGAVENDSLQRQERLTAAAGNFKVAWGEAWNQTGVSANFAQFATYLLEEASYSLEQQNYNTASSAREQADAQDELKTKINDTEQATKDLMSANMDYALDEQKTKEKLEELRNEDSTKQQEILNQLAEEEKRINDARTKEIAAAERQRQNAIQSSNTAIFSQQGNHYDAMSKTTTSYLQGDINKINKAKDEEIAAARTKAQEKLNTLLQTSSEEQKELEQSLEDAKLMTNLKAMELKGTLSQHTKGMYTNADEAFNAIKLGWIEASDEMKADIPTSMEEITAKVQEEAKLQQEEQEKAAEFGRRVAEGSSSAAQRALAQTRDIAKRDMFEMETAARGSLDLIGRLIYDLGIFDTKTSNFISTLSKGLPGVGLVSALGFASGGSFVVPPGYPGDSYPMGVSSGELVTVQPSITNNITQNNNFAGGGSMNLSYSMLQSMVGN